MTVSQEQYKPNTDARVGGWVLKVGERVGAACA